MGVIRNPEKISYMLDTKFIHFREFEIWGGWGSRWRPHWGEGRVNALGAGFFRNSKYKTAILAEKIHCNMICVEGDISSWAT